MNNKTQPESNEARPNEANAEEQIPAVRCCYSVSLVYKENDFDIGNSIIKDRTILRCMVITDGSARSKSEALGIVLSHYKNEVRKEGAYNLMMWDVVEFPPNNGT